MRTRPPHVAVCLDSSRRYGREVLLGIAEYVETFGPWALYLDARSAGTYPADWLRNWKGDGILAYIETEKLARRFQRSGIPTVELFGHRLNLRLPQVGNDEEAVGRLAADHLLERQFRRFAFVGYPGELWVERRFRGFRRAVRGRGHSCVRFDCERTSRTPSRWERTQRRLAAWLRRQDRPVGLMACSDRHAQRVLDAARRAGLNVPGEVGVVGVDNDEEVCRLSDPPLSSVKDDARRVGMEAARLLERLMARRVRASSFKPLLIPPRGVVARRSTDATAVEDPVVASALRAIRERACEGLNVETLIREAAVSRRVLYRRFASALGRTPHDEILRVRLDRAKELLAQTRLRLREIAALAGFDHPEYLSVAFRREVGSPPGAWRRRTAASFPPESGR